MHLPPLRLVRWPLRAAVAACLASVLIMAKLNLPGTSTIWGAKVDNVLPVPVFATVTAIVCAGQTRGATIQASWRGGAVQALNPVRHP
jgi:uncharacterized membrane protein YgaE (UPF0421/DUF939 family)